MSTEPDPQQPVYPPPTDPTAQYPAAQYPTTQYSAGYPVHAQQPPPYYPYPAAPRRGTNSMAIAAFVMLFVLPPLAIVLGTIAGKQIERTGEDGDGFAKAGVIGGIVLTVLAVLAIVGSLLFVYAIVDAVNDLEPR